MSEGGSVKENVKGNYEIRIQKPTAVFSVHSEGNMAFKTLGTLYEVTDGNEYHTVFGKVRETVYGNERSPLAGGNFVGAVDVPNPLVISSQLLVVCKQQLLVLLMFIQTPM